MTTRATAGMPEPAGTDASASRIVLFDFDGVLFHGDAFSMFMRHRYRRSLLCKLLALLTMPWWLLCMVFSRWWAARALVHIALFGIGLQRYQRAIDTFADQLVHRPRQFCRDGLHTLRRHLAAGDEVFVVTGCEQRLAACLLSKLGLAEVGVIGSQLQPAWSGMRLTLHNVGRRKVQSLAAKGVRSWRVAYGDSMYDAAMLKLAHEPVLVNSTPKLCKRIEKALGRTVTRVDWF